MCSYMMRPLSYYICEYYEGTQFAIMSSQIKTKVHFDSIFEMNPNFHINLKIFHRTF